MQHFLQLFFPHDGVPYLPLQIREPQAGLPPPPVLYFSSVSHGLCCNVSLRCTQTSKQHFRTRMELSRAHSSAKAQLSP